MAEHTHMISPQVAFKNGQLLTPCERIQLCWQRMCMMSWLKIQSSGCYKQDTLLQNHSLFFFFLILLIVLEKRDKKQKMKIKSNISRLCILTTILTTNFVFCQAIAKLLTKWRRVFRLLYRKVCRVWNLWHYFWSTQTFLA